MQASHPWEEITRDILTGIYSSHANAIATSSLSKQHQKETITPDNLPMFQNIASETMEKRDLVVNLIHKPRHYKYHKIMV